MPLDAAVPRPVVMLTAPPVAAPAPAVSDIAPPVPPFEHHGFTSCDGHCAANSTGSGSLAGGQGHGATGAGVALAHLQLNVAAVAARGVAGGDRHVSGCTSGCGVASDKRNAAAVAS